VLACSPSEDTPEAVGDAGEEDNGADATTEGEAGTVTWTCPKACPAPRWSSFPGPTPPW